MEDLAAIKNQEEVGRTEKEATMSIRVRVFLVVLFADSAFARNFKKNILLPIFKMIYFQFASLVAWLRVNQSVDKSVFNSMV